MGPEATVERYFKKQAEKHDFLCYKFVSPANDGVPDRIIIGHGHTIFVELKAPGEVPRKLQLRVMEKIKKHGGECYVIDTKDKVDALFNKILGEDTDE